MRDRSLRVICDSENKEKEEAQIITRAFLTIIIIFHLLGARACLQLNRYEEAVTWCDRGLEVSLLTQTGKRVYDSKDVHVELHV